MVAMSPADHFGLSDRRRVIDCADAGPLSATNSGISAAK
jgi:hypothetical protein